MNGESSRSLPSLLPCPFCGGEAYPSTMTISRWKDASGNYGEFTGHAVNCMTCCASNRGVAEGFQTPEAAAAKWNARFVASETAAIVNHAEVIGNVTAALLDLNVTYDGNRATFTFESTNNAMSYIQKARHIVEERLELIRGAT